MVGYRGYQKGRTTESATQADQGRKTGLYTLAKRPVESPNRSNCFTPT